MRDAQNFDAARRDRDEKRYDKPTWKVNDGGMDRMSGRR